MAEYDNTNTFALFKNDKGDNPKRSTKANAYGIKREWALEWSCFLGQLCNGQK